MKSHSILLFAIALPLTTWSCASRPGSKGFVRVSTPVVDDLDADVSSGPLTLSGDTDYEAIDLSLGSLAFRDGVKVSAWEIGVSDAEYEGVETLEYFVGGRFYFGSAPTVQPFLNAQVVYSDFDEDDLGSDFDGHVGVRPGAGMEFAITDSVAVDVLAGYLFPIDAAENDAGIETELEGLTLRFGVAFLF